MTQSPDLKAQITVSTPTTWDQNNPPPSGYEDGIIVGAGSSGNNTILTIEGITLQMKQGARIELEYNNSTLVLDGATITSDDPANNVLWGGIFVKGQILTTYINQYSTFPDPNTFNDNSAWEGVLNPVQTTVIADNSTISFASIGIESLYGGIVRVKNSQFIDNEIGVKISNYQYPTNHPLDKEHEINACRILNSNFTWTYNNPNISNLSKTGIYLNDVKGINIGGCNFQNNDAAAYCVEERGAGIRAYGASFAANTNGNSFCEDEMGCIRNCENGGLGSGNSFLNLSYGIYFSSLMGHNVNFEISYSSFENNYRGIYATHSGNLYGSAKILNNNFQGDRNLIEQIFSTDPSCTPNLQQVMDIYIQNMLNDVYLNTFQFNGNNIDHIVVENIPGMGRIINNTFNNQDPNTIASNNVNGVLAKGTNNRQTVSCNNFNNMGTDIKISQGATLQNPMTDKNGKTPGNKFSSIATGRYRIDNNGNPILDYIVFNNTLDDFHPYHQQNISLSINTIIKEEEQAIDACELKCIELQPDNDFGMNVKNIKTIDDRLSIFPNPANLTLNIKLKASLINNVSIYSISGQKLQEVKFENIQEAALSTANLSSGTYILKVVTNNQEVLHNNFIISR
jgi:hypothetical protein